MNKMIFILLLLILIPFGIKSSNYDNTNNKPIKTELQSGKWIQAFSWKQTNELCSYNCVSLWYTLWKYSTPDEYGYYHYSYVFQSNSKWGNGYLANTGMYGTTIYIDNEPITQLNYGIAGATETTQLNISFKIHYSYVKYNSIISFQTKETYLN